MVANTDRANDTDVFIKNLAFELDALLGSGYVFAAYAGSLTPDSSGKVLVPFPLSEVVGAVIAPTSALPTATGIPAYYDPVPPATIGLYIGPTGYQAFIDSLNVTPGVVRVALRTTTSQKMTPGGIPVQVGYGSRPLSGGAGNIPMAGLAWGVA